MTVVYRGFGERLKSHNPLLLNSWSPNIWESKFANPGKLQAFETRILKRRQTQTTRYEGQDCNYHSHAPSFLCGFIEVYYRGIFQQPTNKNLPTKTYQPTYQPTKTYQPTYLRKPTKLGQLRWPGFTTPGLFSRPMAWAFQQFPKRQKPLFVEVLGWHGARLLNSVDKRIKFVCAPSFGVGSSSVWMVCPEGFAACFMTRTNRCWEAGRRKAARGWSLLCPKVP